MNHKQTYRASMSPTLTDLATRIITMKEMADAFSKLSTLINKIVDKLLSVERRIKALEDKDLARRVKRLEMTNED